ncbi:MAG TPA: alpha-amylase family glycosyl hydrolase, partial [Acholeplasmataceae bacterium]|nr:alpha-amylase family glycosyl hydrolase [Acholeplasmataceae bacterium]
LWAPISSAVTLNLYQTGTPANYGGSDTPTQTIPMIKGDQGVYMVEVNQSLHGTYYTYSVTNGSSTYEVIDPYAKSSGVNGLRGLVVDFSQINPEGFEYNDRPDNMNSYTDAIIYELHVRDLTTHSSWNGTEANRGKYLGLIEKGTSYQGVSTGFDHIVELGVTHVQLLPFFDYGVVDETKVGDVGYNAFNWGYMPLNFNVLEGTYSSDPYNGLTRVIEMKQVVQAFHEENIRINMDVVYNHTGLSADSNFNLIIPGYYHRKTDTGAFSNGSGTGNETASERYMVRKFMVDSVLFWATEYNLSGFRFDLMALHDIETMELIAEELHAIDPTIMVYGEPWMGG